MKRRNFIKISALGGGLLLSLPLQSFSNEKPIIHDLNKFMQIDKEGKITFFLTKHEMGQGASTAIPTIFAEELGADLSTINIQNSDFDSKYTFAEMGTTGGSGSISRIWEPLRNAAATTRELLKQAAANQWKTDTAILNAHKGFIINTINGNKLGFGELAESATKLPIPKNVKLKLQEDFEFIGRPIKNRRTKSITHGNARYGIDQDIDEMVYAAIERCPVYLGKLIGYTDNEAKKVAGVLDVFPFKVPNAIFKTLNPNEGHIQEGVVVVATSTWAAFKAKSLLKIEWDGGVNAERSYDSFKKELAEANQKNNSPNFEIGDIDKEFENNNVKYIDVEYNNPHQAHALMEPLNAVAHYKEDTCEVWAGTQEGLFIKQEVSKLVELPFENIVVHILNSGGSFGRRYHADPSMEAAFISKKVGKPVKLTWTREDEIRHDHCHPHLRNYFKASINDKNEISAFENRASSSNGRAAWTSLWNQIYYFQNLRAFTSGVSSLVHEGAWRSTGIHSASLGKECIIDEMAVAISKDPVDFRLELLNKEINRGDPSTFPEMVTKYIIPARKIIRSRYIEVLEYIKKNTLWSVQVSKNKGRGFAIENFNQSVCAQIVDITLDESELGFKVDKVTAVVHCGQVINPNLGHGQITGAIIWALSALKYGGLEIENGIVQRNNFHNNKVLRIDEIPEMEVVFIKSDDSPTGLGEPGAPPLAPAVLNAIFNATGKRIRKIPVSKDDLI